MRQFGELEAVVMDRLWSRAEPATVREIRTDVNEERPVAYTTVMTVMDNLHRKGFLDREKAGRAWRYRPVKTREEYTADLMREVLDSGADRDATLVHFLGSMSHTEVGDLKAMLERATRRQKP
ncbi:BlaI/MecI/CopY family transcriptional regulator [Solicola gregarius]|uniref:BlaI/MecI/CopY family transcriptional regulator n=1 Tax=Solicola gregarius TaxID=2908642 RepID=A0AA46TIA9_9ACTN|nr:BlaI/MecI/CopY family transcriptional regulator [Solicola gregarius]UYM05673.1 BlaI/MecI/CopY family transcriptional regulator [Solicola gregarius]